MGVEAEKDNDKEFAKRVIDVVVADLKVNGRIKWAMVGVFHDEEPQSERPQIAPEMNPNTGIKS